MTIEKRGQVLNLDVRNKNVNKQDLTPGRFLGDYVYNAKGQRVKKAVNEQTTIYNYDRNGLLMMESTGSGTITAEYVYLNGQPLAKIESNNVYYYHIDHLGTPMMMTDSSGNTVWQGEFKPFGEPVSVTGSITNNLRFPGQYYDSETGLHQNYFRDYNSEIGRYIEADPIGIKRGRNHLFTYVNNNTLNKIDPFGFEVKQCESAAFSNFIPILPHCYFCVNGVSYSWHIRDEEWPGITVGDEDCNRSTCGTLKCCPEKQAEFDQCVKQSAEADIGNEGTLWIPALRDCCVWSNRVVGKCWNKTCGQCECKK